MESIFLKHADFVYTRLIALTWHADDVLQPGIFSAKAGQQLVELLSKHQDSSPVVLNCRGITMIEDHSLTCVRDFITRSGRTFIFMVPVHQHLLPEEISSEVEAKIRKSFREVNDHDRTLDGHRLLFFGPQYQHSLKLVEIICNSTDHLEQSYVSSAITDCYESWGESRRLASTPLMATGLLNARSLISDPGKFSWISLRLTDLFEDLVESIRPRTNRILAVSLRGSPFAGAIRVLANRHSPSLVIVDHMGPQHEMLELHSSSKEVGGGDYIYVGDFIIGGTELKVAKTFLMAHNASLKGAVVIGSYLGSGNHYLSDVELRSLITIPDVIPDLTYSFGTKERA